MNEKEKIKDKKKNNNNCNNCNNCNNDPQFTYIYSLIIFIINKPFYEKCFLT